MAISVMVASDAVGREKRDEMKLCDYNLKDSAILFPVIDKAAFQPWPCAGGCFPPPQAGWKSSLRACVHPTLFLWVLLGLAQDVGLHEWQEYSALVEEGDQFSFPPGSAWMRHFFFPFFGPCEPGCWANSTLWALQTGTRGRLLIQTPARLESLSQWGEAGYP